MKNNPIHDYETALTDLKSKGSNVTAQHKAVLALARMGSLDLAISRYQQYGLDEVFDDEDVMALGGRLSKDQFLTSSGAVALRYAKESAEKYETTFQHTQGFYSGINAATMALVAKSAEDIVHSRVKAVLDLLPRTEVLTAEDYYFVEATRAEAYLLLGQIERCKAALQSAINFDPLNYIAHASTLKQFRMILTARGQRQEWLSEYSPPRPIHFAGHLWKQDDDSVSLKTHLSNVIQKHDIGFAYGALAAGSDIVIAEALLEEGVELNIVLPCASEIFIQESVAPFGDDWAPRFERCLAQAQTLTTLPTPDKTALSAQTMLASHMAMGKAILRSHQFDVSALQMLILDPSRKSSMSLRHKVDWAQTGLEGLEIPLGEGQKLCKPRNDPYGDIAVLVAVRGSTDIQKYGSVDAAMAAIEDSKAQTVALHFDIPGAAQDLRHILESDLDGTILATDVMAGYMSVMHTDMYRLNFAGIATQDVKEGVRFYTVRARR